MMSTSHGINISQQKDKKTNQNIQVYVRLRPLNTREKCIKSSEMIEVLSPKEILTRHGMDSKIIKKFTFDRTFGPESRQIDVYNTVVAPLIEEVLSGYNCTVFAYGQTGTGKTYTMVGTETAELKSSWEDNSEIGIIPRALCHLFDELRMMQVEYVMRISYLELYNEELCDLLSSDDNTRIRIFDDSTKKGSVIIQGLEEVPVHSKDDVYRLLEKGKERRKTASTLMNAQSSRSHTVFSIVVHIRENGIEGEELVKIGKLNLVDLAGSENSSKAGNEKGVRTRETVNINQSLLTLGRVITALVERTPHIPYRESKLTRLLQESLGGRTKTSIIATVSPGHKDIEESLSTLEYAHRAKNIQNKPEVNQKLNKRTVLKEYSDEIDKLKRDLAAARDKNGVYLAEETYGEMTLKMESQNRELNEKMLLLKALKEELANKERMFNEISLTLVDKTEELKKAGKLLTETQKILHSTKKRYNEKKILLRTHMTTENTLRQQACQILNVADTAANDTRQLQSSIERRRNVDKKIQTASEHFYTKICHTFENMDQNLVNYKEKHEEHTKVILEEFRKCKTMDSVINAANIEDLRRTFLECERKNWDLFEAYLRKSDKLSEDHKYYLDTLFETLNKEETFLKSEMKKNLHDVENFNKHMKNTFETIQKLISQLLCATSINSQDSVECIKREIEETKNVALLNIKILQPILSQIEDEQFLQRKQQSIINDFVQNMQIVQNQQFAVTNKIKEDISNILDKNTHLVSSLEKIHNGVEKLITTVEENNDKLMVNISNHVDDMNSCFIRNPTTCNIQKTIENFCVNQKHHLENCIQSENNIVDLFKDTRNNFNTACKHSQVENKSSVLKITENLAKLITKNAEKFNERTLRCETLTEDFSAILKDYSSIYEKHIEECRHTVRNFKHSELQTYVATGLTPSKRDFIYPRVLAATSPHDRIIKRLRQENDWSDLDTSTTIEECSLIEEKTSPITEILEVTPLDLKGKNVDNRN